MPIDDLLVERARRMNRPAIVALLEGMYPAVHRLAHGLAGREDVARGTIRYVLTHAVKHLPAWRDGAEAERWFYHFTVLTARRAAIHGPDANHDLLAPASERLSAQYVAFVRSLRSLPIQQREAFLLRFGEGLDERHVAVAMDCSTSAAAQHLHGAMATLELLSGSDYEPSVPVMREVYWGMSPQEEAYRPVVKDAVTSALLPRSLRRLVTVLVVVGVIAGLLYWLRRMGVLRM